MALPQCNNKKAGLAGQVTGKFDLKEPYYRQLTTPWWQGADATNTFANMGVEAANSFASMGFESPHAM
jgi:hypothetical protein